MRITLIACAAALILTSCSPMKLMMNTTAPDGERTLATVERHLFNDFDVCLGASVHKKDTLLGIAITCDKTSDHGLFDKGDKMKIRLTDESVIELTNLYHKEFEKEIETYSTVDRATDFGVVYTYDPWFGSIYVDPVSVSRMVPRVNTRTITKSYALYLISRSDLKNIIEKGVIALRIELEDSEYNMSDTERVAPILKEMYECLNEGIINGKNRTEF